jgi:hypothetical protein
MRKFSNEEWEELVAYAISVLENCARHREVTSYSKFNMALGDGVGGDPPFDFAEADHERNAMARLLSDVNDRTFDRIGGMLSALVKYLNDNDPGAGFYRLAKQRGYMEPREDRLAFWTGQLNTVLDHFASPPPGGQDSAELRAREPSARAAGVPRQGRGLSV